MQRQQHVQRGKSCPLRAPISLPALQSAATTAINISLLGTSSTNICHAVWHALTSLPPRTPPPCLQSGLTTRQAPPANAAVARLPSKPQPRSPPPSPPLVPPPPLSPPLHGPSPPPLPLPSEPPRCRARPPGPPTLHRPSPLPAPPPPSTSSPPPSVTPSVVAPPPHGHPPTPLRPPRTSAPSPSSTPRAYRATSAESNSSPLATSPAGHTSAPHVAASQRPTRPFAAPTTNSQHRLSLLAPATTATATRLRPPAPGMGRKVGTSEPNPAGGSGHQLAPATTRCAARPDRAP
jgi:hypothetical protein